MNDVVVINILCDCFFLDCMITVKNSLDSKVTGEYGVTPFQNEGRPVWVNLPDQNRYIYFNAHKNYGRWMISLINGDVTSRKTILFIYFFFSSKRQLQRSST